MTLRSNLKQGWGFPHHATNAALIKLEKKNTFLLRRAFC